MKSVKMAAGFVVAGLLALSGCGSDGGSGSAGSSDTSRFAYAKSVPVTDVEMGVNSQNVQVARFKITNNTDEIISASLLAYADVFRYDEQGNTHRENVVLGDAEGLDLEYYTDLVFHNVNQLAVPRNVSYDTPVGYYGTDLARLDFLEPGKTYDLEVRFAFNTTYVEEKLENLEIGVVNTTRTPYYTSLYSGKRPSLEEIVVVNRSSQIPSDSVPEGFIPIDCTEWVHSEMSIEGEENPSLENDDMSIAGKQIYNMSFGFGIFQFVDANGTQVFTPYDYRFAPIAFQEVDDYLVDPNEYIEKLSTNEELTYYELNSWRVFSILYENPRDDFNALQKIMNAHPEFPLTVEMGNLAICYVSEDGMVRPWK